MPLVTAISDLQLNAEILRRSRYGVIEVTEGRLLRILLRPFPKIISAAGVTTLGRWGHRRTAGDRVRLFYNQPWRFSNYLVLKYVESARDTTLRSMSRALEVLDEVARLKQSDALLCDVCNRRISHRLLARYGWEPHCPARFHRHYIKRFYGEYPQRDRRSPS